jgi:hypothetical protein
VQYEQQADKARALLEHQLAEACAQHERTVLAGGKRVRVRVLFSSVGSGLGHVGQSGYAAANALLDAFASFHRARGQIARSIQWPLVSEVEQAVYAGASDGPPYELDVVLIGRARAAMIPGDWHIAGSRVPARDCMRSVADVHRRADQLTELAALGAGSLPQVLSLHYGRYGVEAGA